MEIVRRRWEEYLLPTVMGTIGGIVLGVWAPGVARYASGTTAGFSEIARHTAAECLRRYAAFFNGNFSDPTVWEAPLIGAAIGMFIHFIRAETEF